MEKVRLVLSDTIRAELFLLARELGITESEVITSAIAYFRLQKQKEDDGMMTCYVEPDSRGKPRGRMHIVQPIRDHVRNKS